MTWRSVIVYDVQKREAEDSRTFVRVAETLRKAIADGDYTPGQKLPSGQDLSAELGVAIGTVRSALDLLRQEGLITTRHGQGSFVLDRPEQSGGHSATDDLTLVRAELAEINRRLESIEERLGEIDR